MLPLSSLDPWWLEHLVCPRDHRKLTQAGDQLECGEHRYPIVQGVPVMLLDDVPHTLDIAGQSLRAAGSGQDRASAAPRRCRQGAAAHCGGHSLPLPAGSTRLPQPSGFEVRYWTRSQLRQLFRPGFLPAQIDVDCYFGIGLQVSNVDLRTPRLQLVTRMSESLKAVSERLSTVARFADSVFVTARRSQV